MARPTAPPTAPPAERRASERAAATRRHILDTAALAFAEHGFRGVSLNDIVRESGLTKGAFYFHFPSKEALALAVFRDKQERWVGRTMEGVTGKERAREQLHAMLDIGCEMYETDPSARVVGRICSELAQESDLAPHVTTHLKVWFDLTEQLIRRAQEEGDARRDLDARSAAETIVCAFIGIEQISDVLSRGDHLRRRMEGLRALVDAALEPR